MKRITCAVLAMMVCLGVFAGCAGEGAKESASAPVESPEPCPIDIREAFYSYKENMTVNGRPQVALRIKVQSLEYAPVLNFTLGVREYDKDGKEIDLKGRDTIFIDHSLPRNSYIVVDGNFLPENEEAVKYEIWISEINYKNDTNWKCPKGSEDIFEVIEGVTVDEPEEKGHPTINKIEKEYQQILEDKGYYRYERVMEGMKLEPDYFYDEGLYNYYIEYRDFGVRIQVEKDEKGKLLSACTIGLRDIDPELKADIIAAVGYSYAKGYIEAGGWDVGQLAPFEKFEECAVQAINKPNNYASYIDKIQDMSFMYSEAFLPGVPEYDSDWNAEVTFICYWQQEMDELRERNDEILAQQKN